MRKTRRTSRVGENIRDALVDVFRHDLKEVSLGLSSITGVEVSPDLHLARVFISGFNEEETQNVIRALHGLRGKVRHFLGKRIRLRYTPELEFKYDETSARAGRIEELLSEVTRKNDDHDDDKS
jgi:ribosome-binding factor A